MPHLIFLETHHAASNFPEQHCLRGIALPDSPAVHDEIAEMLLNAGPAPLSPPGPARRIRIWLPRLALWLRAVPRP